MPVRKPSKAQEFCAKTYKILALFVLALSSSSLYALLRCRTQLSIWRRELSSVLTAEPGVGRWARGARGLLLYVIHFIQIMYNIINAYMQNTMGKKQLNYAPLSNGSSCKAVCLDKERKTERQREKERGSETERESEIDLGACSCVFVGPDVFLTLN